MEGGRLIGFGRRLLASVGYGAAYWLLWQLSFDQWFLPAGLRFTVFLLTPLRYWPYVLMGDAAALLVIRLPMIDNYGPLWTLLSPFLLGPWAALAISAIRIRLHTVERYAQWLPAIGIGIAIWANLGNVIANTALSGPKSFDTLEKSINSVIGNYLGILLIALPVFFFALGRHRDNRNRAFTRDIAITVALIATAYATLTVDFGVKPPINQLLLMLMFLPSAWLTVSHGWRGAAAGIFIVNLAIAQTINYTNEQAARNYDIFLVQCALALAASVMLAVGTKISLLYDRARKLGLSEQQALDMARSNLLFAEGNLREQVLFMAQMQIYMDDQRKQLVEQLKANGKATEAMLLNSAAVEHMQAFERRATAIYPLKIEEKGLYGVIFPETFTEFWAGDAEVLFLRATGQPRHLSVDLQLTAYRCICNAFTVLAQGAPTQYTVKLSTRTRGQRRGIAFKIVARPTQPPQVTRSGAMAEIDLERRVQAYGGALGRHHLDCVHVLLWEATSAQPGAGRLSAS